MPRRNQPAKQPKPESPSSVPRAFKWAGLIGSAAIIVSLIAYLSGRASASDLDAVKADVAVDKAQHANDHEAIADIKKDTAQLIKDMAELKAMVTLRR